MAYYRIYELNALHAIVAATDVTCRDDDSAIMTALAAFNRGTIELWSGTRKVATLDTNGQRHVALP